MYYRGYQKFLNVLLCDDDKGENEGKGLPVNKGQYADCVFLESTGMYDKNQTEIFEGDILKIKFQGKTIEGPVEYIPDSFGNKNAHPLESVFKANGLKVVPQNLEIEIIGNIYEKS